ncbi:unnamed protein product, partial [Brenthis ino]
MSSDLEEDATGPSTPKKYKKTKHRTQKYRTQWESEGEFKDWIGPDENNINKAYCKLSRSAEEWPKPCTLSMEIMSINDLRITSVLIFKYFL